MIRFVLAIRTTIPIKIFFMMFYSLHTAKHKAQSSMWVAIRTVGVRSVSVFLPAANARRCCDGENSKIWSRSLVNSELYAQKLVVS